MGSSVSIQHSGGLADNLGIYRANRDGTLQNIVQAGQYAPDRNGSFTTNQLPIINEQGVFSFSVGLPGPSGGLTTGTDYFPGQVT